LDIDIEALKEARQRDPKLAVVVADLYALPFSAGTFDLVWSNSTIEHLSRPLSALAEMRRVARQGGYLFVGVPYRRGPLWFQPWISKTRLGIWLGPVFGNEQLLQLADQLRLRVIETRVYFFRFFVGMLVKLA
jgi:SAM-dependent methyltransferase